VGLLSVQLLVACKRYLYPLFESSSKINYHFIFGFSCSSFNDPNVVDYLNFKVIFSQGNSDILGTGWIHFTRWMK